MRLFFGVSYSHKVDANGSVLPEYRRELEELINVARSLGHTVFCAPEHDNWKINNVSAAEAYRADTAELDEADVFVGYIETDRPSTGVCMETMRAAMQSKPLLVVTDKENPVYMIRGMVESEDFASHAVCPNQQARVEALQVFLSQFEPV